MDGLWHEAEGSARQPLQVVMAGLDALLETLSEKVDLKRVVKIGGCAHVRLSPLLPLSAPLRSDFDAS